jgi:hypothetical protein
MKIQEIIDKAFSPNGGAWGSKEHATVQMWNEFVTITSRANNPRKNGLMQYRTYYNTRGEKVAHLTSRYGNWYDPTATRRTAVVLNEKDMAKIGHWLMTTDPSITRVIPSCQAPPSLK